MKEKKILEALTDVDDEFVEEAYPERKSSNKIKYIKYLAIAACFALLVCASIPLVKNLTETPVISEEETTSEVVLEENMEEGYTFKEEANTELAIEEEYTFQEEANTELAIEGPNEAIDENFWKNLKINQQYNTVYYKEVKYYNNNTTLKKSEAGEKISSAEATGIDPFNNKRHTKDVTVYRLKNISDKVAIAVKFEESDKYFIFVNHFCEFETLGEIINEFKLRKNMKIKAGYYREEDISLIKYEKIDASVISENLFFDTELKKLNEPDEILLSDFLFEIEISPFSPSVKHTISVTKSGYLLVNVFHTQQVFFIGKEKAVKFIDYVMENHNGKKLVYTTDPPVVYNESAEKAPVTEVFSNGYKP